MARPVTAFVSHQACDAPAMVPQAKRPARHATRAHRKGPAHQPAHQLLRHAPNGHDWDSLTY